jgi:hypothetical protein
MPKGQPMKKTATKPMPKKTATKPMPYGKGKKDKC